MATVEAKDAPLRSTGKMERFNILRTQVKFYTNVQVSATYTIPRKLFPTSTVDGLQTLIFAALKETLDHQPIMGVTIADEGTSEPKWARLSKIDLREVVKLIDANSEAGIDQWVQEGHGFTFERLELPLWRVVIAAQEPAMTRGKNGDFIFTVGFFCHHAIGDGKSGGAFHLTFLDALNALLDGKIELPIDITDAATIFPPTLPLLPSLEMSTKLPISIFFALKQIINTYVYSTVDPLNWSGPLISADAPLPTATHVRSFSLPPTLVNTLLAQCRKQKTSITALLTVLIARRLSALYPTHSRFAGTVPFSFRKFSGHAARDMGCYVSNVEPLFSSEAKCPSGYISCRSSPTSGPTIDDEELWKSARETKRFIDAKTASPKDQMVGLLKFISNFPRFFYGKLGCKRDYAFEVSNIGVLDGGASEGGMGKGKVTFDRVMFTSSHSCYGAPFGLYVASAKDGDMNVALCWEQGVVMDEEAVGLLSWLEGALRVLTEV